MDPLTIIGLGLSGSSLIDRWTGGAITKFLGGKTDSQIRERRRNDYIAYIRQLKTNTLERENKLFREGLRSVRQATTGAIENSRQAGARRAKAMGRETDVESFVAPTEQKIAEAGAESVKSYNLAGQKELSNTAKYFDSLAAQAEYEYQQAPIEPNFMETAGDIGSALVQYGQTRETIKALEPQTAGAQAPPTTIKPIDANMYLGPELSAPPAVAPMESDLLIGPNRRTPMSAPMQKPLSFLGWSGKKKPSRYFSLR